MLQFILGLFIGGIVGFGICAFLSVVRDDQQTESLREKEAGDSNA